MSVAIVGLALGLLLLVVSFFMPKLSLLLQLAAVLATQSGAVPQLAFMLAMCIYAGGQWGTQLLHTYFSGDKNWDTETASKLCNTIGWNAWMGALPINIGAGLLIAGGAAAAYAGLSKFMIVLSLPLIMYFLVQKVQKMGKGKIAFISTVVIATVLAIGFIVVSGSPLAMGAIVSVMMLSKPTAQKQHNTDKISKETWEVPTTGSMWSSLAMSTILIGLPNSLVYEKEKGTDAEIEVRGGVIELLSSHFSTLLFLVLGMARTAGADAMSKAITTNIDPVFSIGCIVIIVILQAWTYSNMPALIERYLAWRPMISPNAEWVLSVGTVFCTCLLIGMPLGQCLVFLGAALLLNQVIDKLNIRNHITGIFSTIPLIGITLL